MRDNSAQAGFILLDTLVAATLLALGASWTALIVVNSLRAEHENLDRLEAASWLHLAAAQLTMAAPLQDDPPNLDYGAIQVEMHRVRHQSTPGYEQWTLVARYRDRPSVSEVTTVLVAVGT